MMADCLGLASGLMPSHGRNIGVLGGKHQSKASMTYGLGRCNKCALWHRCRECEIVSARAYMGSARNISQVHEHMGAQV